MPYPIKFRSGPSIRIVCSVRTLAPQRGSTPYRLLAHHHRAGDRNRSTTANEADPDAAEDDRATERGVDRRLLCERDPRDERSGDRFAEHGERDEVRRRRTDGGIEQAVAHERRDQRRTC